MDACQPRVRRRGFFLHSDTTGEAADTEMENPEGFVVRVRIARSAPPRQVSGTAVRGIAGGRMQNSRAEVAANEALPEIRSGSVTGSRQRAHSHR